MSKPDEVEIDRTVYTRRMIDKLLDLYFRDSPRAAPFSVIAKALGSRNLKGLEDMVYMTVSGYSSFKIEGTKKCERREYRPTRHREDRTGRVWYKREDDALRLAMDPKLAGQTKREPRCDIPYIAAVLARPEAEVAARWQKLSNPLNLVGFGLGLA